MEFNQKMKVQMWKGTLISAVLISACVRPIPSGKDWRPANIHKVVIVCVQGNQQENRRIESNMVPKFQRQGFDPIAIQDLFPSASAHSPKEMLEQMQQAQIDGIMEITHSGVNPADGQPRQVKFKYHAIKGRTVKLTDRPAPLDAAIIELIGGTAR